jgi:hypothetical protein
VDVTADHPVVAFGARMRGGVLLEPEDVARRHPEAELEALGEGPVGLAEAPAHVVDEVADADGAPVHEVPELLQPGGAVHDAVELVAVQHQQALAPGGAVHPLAVHLELPAQHLRQHGKAGIVVAGDVDEAGPGALPGEQRAHHLRVLGAPVGAPRQAPGIDDVADEDDGLGLHACQELVELACAGMAEP